MALSSTPLLAQTTGTADPAAPVIVAPPPPPATTPPAAVQTTAPEATPAPMPAPVVAAPTPTPAPAPAMKTVGTPVVHQADATPTESDAATAPTRAVAAPVKRISAAPATRTSAPAAAAPIAGAKVTPAKAPAPAAPLPAAVAKNVPTAAETAAATPPAAAPVATTQTSQVSSSQDETLPIVGGIALIVIALGGGAYALSRRRRDEGELVLEPAPTETVMMPEAEPVMAAPMAAATPMAAPVAGEMPRTLPNGFDISRFGRHTQAAYLGPTPDNPSASLKHRLRRASFFDQREREAREAAAAGRPAEQATPIEAPVQAAKQDDGQVTVRLSPQRKGGGFGYVLQR
jgi:hypothetical protein